MNAATLLIALVERSNEEVAAVLHERVRFRQGDGTEHHGSEAVLAMFARSERGVRYTVVDVAGDAVRVVIEVPGVSERFSFLLCGRVEEARLVEVWVEG
jgi:hypothetical protein